MPTRFFPGGARGRRWSYLHGDPASGIPADADVEVDFRVRHPHELRDPDERPGSDREPTRKRLFGPVYKGSAPATSCRQPITAGRLYNGPIGAPTVGRDRLTSRTCQRNSEQVCRVFSPAHPEGGAQVTSRNNNPTVFKMRCLKLAKNK